MQLQMPMAVLEPCKLWFRRPMPYPLGHRVPEQSLHLASAASWAERMWYHYAMSPLKHGFPGISSSTPTVGAHTHMHTGIQRNKETELRALEMRARCAMEAMAGGSARAQKSAEAIMSETRSKHQRTTDERIGSLKSEISVTHEKERTAREPPAIEFALLVLLPGSGASPTGYVRLGAKDDTPHGTREVHELTRGRDWSILL